MKAKAIVKICLCALLALVLIGALCTALFVVDLPENALFGINVERYADAKEYVTGDGSVSGNVSELDIHWTSGDVTISVSDGDEIVFRERGAADDEPLYWLAKNGTLTIRDRKSGVLWGWVSSDRHLEIELPKAALRTLRLDCASADLTLTGITADTLEVNTASGEVRASKCELECVDIDSASGACQFDACVLGRFEMDTASGAATLRGSVERVEFDAASGDLDIVSSIAPYSIEVDAVSGNTQLIIPADAGFEAELESVSGDLRIEGFTGQYHRDGFVCGNGKAEYSFDTVSGDVIIRPAE